MLWLLFTRGRWATNWASLWGWSWSGSFSLFGKRRLAPGTFCFLFTIEVLISHYGRELIHMIFLLLLTFSSITIKQIIIYCLFCLSIVSIHQIFRWCHLLAIYVQCFSQCTHNASVLSQVFISKANLFNSRASSLWYGIGCHCLLSLKFFWGFMIIGWILIACGWSFIDLKILLTRYKFTLSSLQLGSFFDHNLYQTLTLSWASSFLIRLISRHNDIYFQPFFLVFRTQSVISVNLIFLLCFIVNFIWLSAF